MKIVLLSTYELGRQPFGLASPAAWLRRDGHQVMCVDLSVSALPALEIREADLIAIYLPMHTATRMASEIIRRIRLLNRDAHLCGYGLYAPMNVAYLRDLGVQTIIGGEFERELCLLAARLNGPGTNGLSHPPICLDKLQFIVPDRSTLPPPARYPKVISNGSAKKVGYVEASRGCKHYCRHCPVVPVYNGAFRIVQAGVVLEDIRRQVAAGAEHITFGDPDFFNGPAHALKIVEALHSEFPELTYDVTIKVEHLIQQQHRLRTLTHTGCLFVTTAVESLNDHVLQKLEKGHTRKDFFRVVNLFHQNNLALAPTFIPFTPWTTLGEYAELLDTVARLNLIEAVSPVQLSLRLLIPSGSRLLELEDIRRVIGPFDTAGLCYPWKHPDPQVDELAGAVLRLVKEDARARRPRRHTFERIWNLVHSAPPAENFGLLPRATIPYMEEPWFC